MIKLAVINNEGFVYHKGEPKCITALRYDKGQLFTAITLVECKRSGRTGPPNKYQKVTLPYARYCSISSY